MLAKSTIHANIFVQKHQLPLKNGYWAKIVTAVGGDADALCAKGPDAASDRVATLNMNVSLL